MEPTSYESAPAETWERMEPVLNEALAELAEADRCAVLLRFFEKRPMKDVAAAMGLNEAAAKKRVARAVEKLRLNFQRRGVAVPTAVLAAALTLQTVQAAPGGLAATVASNALLQTAALSVPTSTLTVSILKLMALPKLKAAVVAAAAFFIVGGTTALVVRQIHHRQQSLGDEEILRIINTGNSAELEQAPPLVFLRESRTLGIERHIITANGKLMGREASLRTLLSLAYGVSESRMVTDGDLPDKRYDFLVSLDSDQKPALQQAIQENAGVLGQQESREQDVYLLRVMPGEFPGRQASASARSGTSVNTREGELRLSNATIGALVRNLERILGRPVVDESSLAGRFNLFLTWEPAAEQVTERSDVKKALAEQLGLELIPAKRPVDLLIVQSGKAQRQRQ